MAWTTITNGLTGLEVSNKLNAEFATLESNITSLQTDKADQPVIVLQSSDLTNQVPTALNTALKVKFGATVNNTYVFLDTDGTVTFKQAGHYHVEVRLQVGRTGVTGTALLLARCVKNGVQYGGGSAFKLADSEVLFPCVANLHLDIEVDDTFYFQIIRDASGDNSGGLYMTDPSDGWSDIPSANITITKIG